MWKVLDNNNKCTIHEEGCSTDFVPFEFLTSCQKKRKYSGSEKKKLTTFADFLGNGLDFAFVVKHTFQKILINVVSPSCSNYRCSFLDDNTK